MEGVEKIPMYAEFSINEVLPLLNSILLLTQKNCQSQEIFL